MNDGKLPSRAVILNSMNEAAPKKGVNPLVKVFVLMHMILTLGWSVPPAAPAIASGSIPLTPANFAAHPVDFALQFNDEVKGRWPLSFYLTSTGLWQYWDMFAPNPSNLDIWWDSIVTFKSGKTEVVKYPRMKDLSIGEKYLKERYRKYLERMNNDSTDSWKRPAFAQRMALLAYKDPNDPPVQVQLRRHWREMEGMDKPIPPQYKEFVLFTYYVDQDKLMRDAGK